MNRERRKALFCVSDKIRAVKDDLEGLKAEEERAYENLPEGIQMGKQGDALAENIGLFEEMLDNLESTLDLMVEIE